MGLGRSLCQPQVATTQAKVGVQQGGKAQRPLPGTCWGCKPLHPLLKPQVRVGVLNELA